MGLTPTDLGTLTQAEITDSALAEAAFATQADNFVLIDGIVGKRAVFVSAIEPGGQLSLEDAREQLTNALKLERGRTLFIDVLDQVEELRAAFVDMNDIAGQFDLVIYENEITVTGTELGNIAELEGDNYPRIANTVFEAEVGRLPPSIALGANKNVWFDLLNIEPSRDQTLDEVREELAAVWMGERRAEALSEKADGMVAQIADGMPLAEVAVANGLFPEISSPIGRGGDGTSTLDFSVAGSAHQGGVGHFGAQVNTGGEVVIFQVTSIIPAEDGLTSGESAFIADSYRDNVYSEFAAGLLADANLRINQQTLALVLGLDTSN